LSDKILGPEVKLDELFQFNCKIMMIMKFQLLAISQRIFVIKNINFRNDKE